jgi:hypothetical protein
MRVSQASAPWVPLAVLVAFNLAEARSAKIWVGRAAELEAFLENAEVVSMKELGTGANEPKRLTLRMGDRTLRGLWKPIERGPKEWAWESYETEVAAYEVDRMLGLDMVPPTVVKEIDGQKGSLQLWVDGVQLYEDVDGSSHETVSWEAQMSHMRVFDLLIGNWDRGPRNFMVDDEWNVVLIDHSQAFSSTHYLNEHMDWLPPRFDRELIEKVKRWDVEYLSVRFGRLLLRPQVNAIIVRRNALLRYIDDLIDERGAENVWLDGEP